MSPRQMFLPSLLMLLLHWSTFAAASIGIGGPSITLGRVAIGSRSKLLSPPQRRSSGIAERSRKSSRRRDAWVDPEFEDMLCSGSCGGDSAVAQGSTGMAIQRGHQNKAIRMCSSGSGLAKNLLRGAFLRVASDLTGGTPLESIKCRVTASSAGPIEAYRQIVNEGGFWNLWAGTPARTVEGALLGAAFLVGSVATKKQVLTLTGNKNLAALSGGLVGGVLQAIVMTPAGMIFTSLNMNRGKPGYENDNAITVTKRIVKEKGIMGMFIGGGPMAARQASNWASRGMFTEFARTNLKMSKYGLLGEIGSGVIGGVGSCWNTPIETVRVIMHRDVSAGEDPKSFNEYWNQIVEEGGYPGLFRGVTPRAVQAIWQTVFMVVVPNLMGI